MEEKLSTVVVVVVLSTLRVFCVVLVLSTTRQYSAHENADARVRAPVCVHDETRTVLPPPPGVVSSAHSANTNEALRVAWGLFLHAENKIGNLVSRVVCIPFPCFPTNNTMP